MLNDIEKEMYGMKPCATCIKCGKPFFVEGEGGYHYISVPGEGIGCYCNDCFNKLKPTISEYIQKGKSIYIF